MVYCQDASREMLKTNENNGRLTKKRADSEGSKLESNVSRYSQDSEALPCLCFLPKQPFEMQLMIVGQIM